MSAFAGFLIATIETIQAVLVFVMYQLEDVENKALTYLYSQVCNIQKDPVGHQDPMDPVASDCSEMYIPVEILGQY